jgi:hypothetical protein
VQLQEPLRGVRRDVVALVGHRRGQPGGLARSLRVVHVDLAPARLDDDIPDESGPHDEPDDEQPPVELGVHRREV